MTDLISRADAIEAVRKEYEDAINIGDNGDAIAYDVGRILSALPSADAEQVASKLKKPCDSLLKPDSDECKEQKSKLESADRPQGEWICKDRIPIDGIVFIECECSVCGEKVLFDTMKVDNFCGKCGARMENTK